MSPWTPLLASAAFGFVKGLTSSQQSDGFQVERDFVAPVKEELIYRGGPLWLFPNLPFGATAVVFAADHVIVEMKADPEMTPMELVARFGDVFLGGWLYESAMRGPFGILGAIASHLAHNNAVGLGMRLRNGALTAGEVAAPEEVLT